MKVLYKKKQDEVVAFEDLAMGDFFELDESVYFVIFNKQVAIIKSKNMKTGDIYDPIAVNLAFANKQVKKLDVHLVVNN